MFHIYIDFNLLQVFSRTQIDLGQLFLFSDSLACNAKVLNSDLNKHLVNFHFSHFMLEKGL
jgi:hypothetical protein